MCERKPDPHHDVGLDLIDLKRYPLVDLTQGKGLDFLTTCQAHMETYGWCSFDDFLTPEAVKILAQEAKALLPTAETLTIRRTIYQGQALPGATKEDVRQGEYVHTSRQLADDQIPAQTKLKQLYHSNMLTDFIRQVQQKQTLYRCADEFQALNVVALEPGCWHAWHYDTTECTITLLLQAADKGGEFAFLPNSRTDETEDAPRVQRLLSGDMSVAKTLSRGAGTLTLFRGGYSLHGVTEVEGTLPRTTAIMTYSEDPGTVLSDEVNIRIYGDRVKNILAARARNSKN